ncbi:MAG TPA: aminotransferase class I/II-fold pyridoxal phosphate-dependent enzyme, partial [Chitinophagales bacterium]|nr:aminotransferase class I/II-fold pyridoxal phosphate-dependent enzyme [Chitinophagales bacterium]
MKNEFNELINQHATKGKELGFYHLFTEDEQFNGRTITVNGRETVFFSSCSYLGLETHPALKAAAIEAVQKYGTQFSSSRMTVSMGMYEELEGLLGQIFGKPTYLAPTTSLGHIAIIPTMMGKGDAIIMDQQVHNSVKNAVQMVKPEGVHTEILKHNRMDMLETRIQILRQDHTRVWYMIDSIYSMYGDSAPFDDICALLNKYEQLHLYIDDAHGMSWAGTHGRGYALSKMPYHPRMILTSSLAKGFGSCGGALAFYDEDQKNLIRNCSGPSIFSGPLQPAVLGASIASAKLHLSDEIENLQDQLFEKMLYFTQTAKRYGLPLVGNELTPIFFMGLGKKEISYKVASFLKKEGFYCMTTVFPAVPLKNSGLRITVHNHLSFEDIDGILGRIAEILPFALREEGSSMDEIYEAFNMQPKQEIIMPQQRLL